MVACSIGCLLFQVMLHDSATLAHSDAAEEASTPSRKGADTQQVLASVVRTARQRKLDLPDRRPEAGGAGTTPLAYPRFGLTRCRERAGAPKRLAPGLVRRTLNCDGSSDAYAVQLAAKEPPSIGGASTGSFAPPRLISPVFIARRCANGRPSTSSPVSWTPGTRRAVAANSFASAF